MKVLDANLLLYAYDSKSVRHRPAKEWVERIFSSGEPVGLPWQTIHAFLRVSTNHRLQAQLTLEQAAQFVQEWVSCSNTVVLAPGPRHWEIFQRVAIGGQASGALLSDALLAALAIEWGGTLCTTDRDFARFPGLRWTNPLE